MTKSTLSLSLRLPPADVLKTTGGYPLALTHPPSNLTDDEVTARRPGCNQKTRPVRPSLASRSSYVDGMGIQISCVSGNAPRHPHNSGPTQRGAPGFDCGRISYRRTKLMSSVARSSVAGPFRRGSGIHNRVSALLPCRPGRPRPAVHGRQSHVHLETKRQLSSPPSASADFSHDRNRETHTRSRSVRFGVCVALCG